MESQFSVSLINLIFYIILFIIIFSIMIKNVFKINKTRRVKNEFGELNVIRRPSYLKAGLLLPL